MANTLVSLSDLASFPAAEGLEQAWLDIAVAGLRAEASWHIAPSVSETISVWSSGSGLIWLPSKRVTAVTTVAQGAVTYTQYDLRPGPVLASRSGVWPYGNISVTLTHGYTACPADLLPVVISRAWQVPKSRDPNIRSKSVDGVTVAYFEGLDDSAMLAKYGLLGVA